MFRKIVIYTGIGVNVMRKMIVLMMLLLVITGTGEENNARMSGKVQA